MGRGVLDGRQEENEVRGVGPSTQGHTAVQGIQDLNPDLRGPSKHGNGLKFQAPDQALEEGKGQAGGGSRPACSEPKDSKAGRARQSWTQQSGVKLPGPALITLQSGKGAGLPRATHAQLSGDPTGERNYSRKGH